MHDRPHTLAAHTPLGVATHTHQVHRCRISCNLFTGLHLSGGASVVFPGRVNMSCVLCKLAVDRHNLSTKYCKTEIPSPLRTCPVCNDYVMCHHGVILCRPAHCLVGPVGPGCIKCQLHLPTDTCRHAAADIQNHSQVGTRPAGTATPVPHPGCLHSASSMQQQ